MKLALTATPQIAPSRAFLQNFHYRKAKIRPMTDISTVDPDALVGDPRWLPHRFHVDRGVVAIGKFSRDALSDASFLDYRIEPKAEAWTDVPLKDFLNLGSLAAAPLFIFHTSYCCSTLLSRALDRPGAALSLKEPEIVMSASNMFRTTSSDNDRRRAQEFLKTTLSLLARPFARGERVVVKPTNAANNLAPIVVAAGAPTLILYGGLREFLTSVIKKGETCRTMIRQIYRVYAMDGTGVAAIPQRDALALTDLQIAALVWRHQMELFADLLDRSGANPVRTLDFKTFLPRPRETLEAASALFELEADPRIWLDAAEGPLFARDAKDAGRPYNAERQARDERGIMEAHAETIDLIEDWAMALSIWPRRTRMLAQPLLGE